MGLLDEAKDAAQSHEKEVDGAIDKGGDLIDEKTGDSHKSQVDEAQTKAEEFLK